MNSPNPHALLVAPPVSRAAFFAQLLAAPSPLLQPENTPDELSADSVTGLPAPPVAPAPTAPTGFPA